MTNQPMEQFAILKEAGVLPGYFARMNGFSRVSVSMWVNGRCSPHPLHRSAVLAALQQVKAAYDGGRLPLKRPVKRCDVYSLLCEAIQGTPTA